MDLQTVESKWNIGKQMFVQIRQILTSQISEPARSGFKAD
jgi:hypothetical protein